MAVAEALACERPVLVTRSGGPETLVEAEYGIVVEPNDPTALARAIQELALGTARFDAAAGRRRIVERFGPNAFLDRIGRIYDELIR